MKTPILNKNVEIIYKMEDGRTSVVNGEILSKSKKSFIMKMFKRAILSFDKKKYDLCEITSAKIEIFCERIEKINSISRKFNFATEGWDDGGY